ncbi:hypothetical protein Q3C01_41095 [Bradyrhizobium sp. UFLA05-109]
MNAFGRVDVSAAVREGQDAMNFGMLLQEFNDIAQRRLDLRVLGAHGVGGHEVDR